MTTDAFPAPEDGARSHFVATRPDLTAAVFRDIARQRQRQLWGLTILLSVLAAMGFAAFGMASPILPPVLLLLTAVPFLLWHFPKVTLFVVLGMACLVEGSPTGFSDALTDLVPFFWNVNTIFQRYAHMNLKAVPVSPLEMLLVLAFVCTVLRSVFSGTARLKVGPLFIPIIAYLAFVTVGWIHGVATGGDFKISLMEVRAQFYFGAAYLMALYLAPERKTQRAMLWVFAACVAIKALLYSFRRWVTMSGQIITDQGVGSHEEAFFFVTFFALLGILTLTGTGKGHGLRRLHGFLWMVAPVVFLGLVATNRRAGTGAIVVAAAVLFLSALRGFPERRRSVAIIALTLSLLGLGYYSAFKNSPKSFAQPARAIKSHFQPDARDASSNAYRDAENENLMHNVRNAPVLGIGYGKRMSTPVPMADISYIYEYWDILPHNQILWVWMRTGSVGFFAFWMMVAAILVRACAVLRRSVLDAADEVATREYKQIALLAMLAVSNLLIFALLDLQLSNSRDMLFVGMLTGVLATLPVAVDSEKKAKAADRSLAGGRP